MIGYCVSIDPKLASFRLRVALPSKHLKIPHVIGGVGDVTFFYKNGSPSLARKLKNVVYDVVNAHFEDPDYWAMCEAAQVITCASPVMAQIIKKHTDRDAVVIPDPYENVESPPAIPTDRVLWFGHQANISSLHKHYADIDADIDADICTAAVWSLENEALALEKAGVVLLTGNNPGASANRVIKAIRAGRFVVAPEDCPESWEEMYDFMWIGDVREGIKWAFANREEACQRVQLGQNYIRSRFSPQLIGSRWADLFVSTLAADINKKMDGSVLTSQ